MVIVTDQSRERGRVLFSPPEHHELRGDAASDPAAYRAWLAARPEPATPDLQNPPEVGVLLVVDRPDPVLLDRALRSVVAQTYDRWAVSAVVVGDLDSRARAVLEQLAIEVPPGRLTSTSMPAGTETAGAAAAALDHSTSPYVLLLGQDDAFAPRALELLVGALVTPVGERETPSVYGDEDLIARDEGRSRPSFKPEWSPELLLATPYVGRPFLCPRETLVESGGIRPMGEGDWEHDLVLRVTEHGPVRNISEVLYHRSTEQAAAAEPTAVVSALARRAEPGSVERGVIPGTWHVSRRSRGTVRTSMVIPFRNEPRFLRTCIDSIARTTRGLDLELLLVDNGSTDPETESLLERLAERPEVRILADPAPFNWAEINNRTARQTSGEVLLFLNNDIEACRDGWLDALLVQVLRPAVGVAAGARLLYPDRRLQHAGIVIGLGGAAGHLLAGLDPGAPGYLGLATVARECSAVTGACLATRRSVFEELGGFDEGLGLELNDVDFCLRVGQAGYSVLYEPAAELVHYESPSRGTSGSGANIRRFLDRWEPALRASDPFLSPNLTRSDASCALRDPDEGARWEQWRSTLPEA